MIAVSVSGVLLSFRCLLADHLCVVFRSLWHEAGAFPKPTSRLAFAALRNREWFFLRGGDGISECALKSSV